MNEPTGISRTCENQFIVNMKGERIGQWCEQDDGKLFARKLDRELNGEKLLEPQWRAWVEVK